METLKVDFGEKSAHEIRVSDSFETGTPFQIELQNHGRATHVHLNADASLARLISMDTGNHFVPENGVKRLGIDVFPRHNSATGRLKIAAGHGSEVDYVAVTVDPEAGNNPVTVDESLTNPPPADRPSDSRNGVGTTIVTRLSDIAAVGILLLSVTVASIIGMTIGHPVVLAGVGTVVGGAILAGISLTGWAPGD